MHKAVGLRYSCQVAIAMLGIVISAMPAFGQTPKLVTSAVNESQLVTLAGNTHRLARREFDRGAVSPDLAMDRMLLVLKRSAEQEAALQKFIDELQQPASPNFHKFVTPEEFGERFGASEADVEAVTAWLEAHSFRIGQVSNSRSIIEFSGTASQVANAFHTAIDRFVVNGVEHFANTIDPQIPVALLPVVAGVVSMHNFVAAPRVT